MLSTTALVGALLLSTATAHMQLHYPAPFNATADPYLQYPYNCCGPNDRWLYPCRGYLDLLGTPEGAPTATWEAGSTQYWVLQGIGDHYGGSCQVGFSTDNGENFRVATSYEGNCPHRGAGNGPEGQNFTFTVPGDLAPGVQVFAWTWYNREQEFNMNCAAINITAASRAPDTVQAAPVSSPNNSSSPAAYESSSTSAAATAEVLPPSVSNYSPSSSASGCPNDTTFSEAASASPAQFQWKTANGCACTCLTPYVIIGCTCDCTNTTAACPAPEAIETPPASSSPPETSTPATYDSPSESAAAPTFKYQPSSAANSSPTPCAPPAESHWKTANGCTCACPSHIIDSCTCACSDAVRAHHRRDTASIAFADRPLMLVADNGNGCLTPHATAEVKFPEPGPEVVSGDGAYPLETPVGKCSAQEMLGRQRFGGY